MPRSSLLFVIVTPKMNPTPYSAEYPAATLAAGQNVRWRWPAKNHAETAAGIVKVYIAESPNAGDDFSTTTPIAGQGPRPCPSNF